MPYSPTCAFCGDTITGRVNRIDNRESCDRCFAEQSGRILTDVSEAREHAIERHREREKLENAARRLNEGSRRQRKQYKVLSQTDSFFVGVFNAARIEEAVNHYAAQGWNVVSMTTLAFPGVMAQNHQLVVLLERDYVHPEDVQAP